MTKNFFLFLLAAGLLIGACAPARYVQPLEKGEHSIGLDFGGPVIEFSGMIIPTPLSNIHYGYGLNEKTTLFGSLHLTSLAYGNLQTDLGACYKLLDQNKYLPAVSLSPTLNIVNHFSSGATKIWPQMDANAFWEFGEQKSYAYVGISNWFELSSTRVHNENSIDRWLINPQVGLVFKTASWSYTVEIKLMGLSHKNDYVFVPYRSITGSNGATGLFLGANYRFTPKQK